MGEEILFFQCLGANVPTFKKAKRYLGQKTFFRKLARCELTFLIGTDVQNGGDYDDVLFFKIVSQITKIMNHQRWLAKISNFIFGDFFPVKLAMHDFCF